MSSVSRPSAIACIPNAPYGPPQFESHLQRRTHGRTPHRSAVGAAGISRLGLGVPPSCPITHHRVPSSVAPSPDAVLHRHLAVQGVGVAEVAVSAWLLRSAKHVDMAWQAVVDRHQ